MKKDEKTPDPQSSAEAWSFIIVVLLFCITLVFTTRMYIGANMVDTMVHHYTLRGKNVIVENDQLVFINN